MNAFPSSRDAAIYDSEPSLVVLADQAHLDYWTTRLGASEAQLRHSVEQVGRECAMVQLHLSRSLRQAQAHRSAETPRPQQMDSHRARILVVDDQFGNRDNLETFLQGEGYITDSAGSGEHALMLISERLPDLILLDISMPGMGGLEVASFLKANEITADIPIIMVTAHAGRDQRLAGLSTGVEAYLTKPFDPQELALKVRNLLRLRAHAKSSP
jgi:CheY-like chemotaxis protein